MLWLVLLLVVMFRWPLLEKRIGTVRMFLLDAIMWTAWAAFLFAKPGPIWHGWLDYGCGILSLVWAVGAGRNYLKYDAIVRNIKNEQGKSNTKPDGGSKSA